MKAIFLSMAMTACAVGSPQEQTLTDEQGLICGDNCDPGDAQQYLRDILGGFGGGFGSPVTNTTCQHFPPHTDLAGDYIPAHDECSAVYVDQVHLHYLIDCSSTYGCDSVPCGESWQPTCS